MTRRKVLEKFGFRVGGWTDRISEEVDQTLTELDKQDLTEEELIEILHKQDFDDPTIPHSHLPRISKRIAKIKAQAILSAQRKKRGE